MVGRIHDRRWEVEGGDTWAQVDDVTVALS
jgi:hypothetical protein